MSAVGLMEPDHVKAKIKKVKEVIDPSLKIPGRAPQAGDPAAPAAVTALRKTASTAGWNCETIYARGITNTPKLVHIYAVRMSRNAQRVSALWEAADTDSKLAWKFSYAGVLGVWVAESGIIQPFPFTLNSIEMKAVIKGESMTRKLIMDAQYDALDVSGKDELLISEREFRVPFNRNTKEVQL